MTACYCCSGKEYSLCCEPYIKGDAIPQTAELLMRSRYSAYSIKNIDYIIDTTAPEKRGESTKAELQEWANAVTWLKLEIIESNSDGLVEFKADFMEDGIKKSHHEISFFKKIDSRWYFFDCEYPKAKPVKNESKTGRNDPCPCGSGKKFKKCCA